MKSKEETAIDLKLKINKLNQAILKLKNWNDWHPEEKEKYDLNLERIALLEESKKLFLSKLNELEE